MIADIVFGTLVILGFVAVVGFCLKLCMTHGSSNL